MRGGVNPAWMVAGRRGREILEISDVQWMPGWMDEGIGWSELGWKDVFDCRFTHFL